MQLPEIWNITNWPNALLNSLPAYKQIVYVESFTVCTHLPVSYWQPAKERNLQSSSLTSPIIL